MPGKLPSGLTEIGGKSTDLGRQIFLQKAAERRQAILDGQTDFVDVTESIMSSEYMGTLSKPAAGFAAKTRAKGNKMPKKTSKLNSVTTIAGKRGRKAEFNPADWSFDIGVDNALDVTEEMNSGVEKYCADNGVTFDAELLFSTDNADANKYRTNRFAAFKRVANQANGEKTKYELNHAIDEAKNRVWVLVRTA
jgi:hypothetical protein